MLNPIAPRAEAQEYQLGKEFQFEGETCLVVRIVDHNCLFEIPLKRYVVDELYVELLTERGETKFISLKREVHTIERPATCKMRGPEPLMKMSEDLI